MKVKLSFYGVGRGANGYNATSHKKVSDFIKPEFMRRHIEIDYNNRTDLVRQFYSIFVEREYNYRDICTIRRFLIRKKLTNAEVHAILFRLGFRYKINPMTRRIKNMSHMAIDGYYNDEPYTKKAPSIEEREVKMVQHICKVSKKDSCNNYNEETCFCCSYCDGFIQKVGKA
jgi:hypothetical protein